VKRHNSRKPRTRQRNAGYTILELLVVMGILAMLAAVVAPQAIRYFGRAKSEAAQLQVNQLVTAIEMYYLDTGKYPPQDIGLRALVEAPSGETRWGGPYVRRQDALSDPWGRMYQYRVPGQHGPFDVFSLGRDNAPGGQGENRDAQSW
jgi:general secretion pathway protein G